MVCPYCESQDTFKKGTSRKGAQRYECKACERRFNDLTDTIFAEHKLSIPEMFYIIGGMETKSTAQLTRELDRTYKTVLEFVHEVQEAVGTDEFVLSGIVEADEVYVTAGEKGEQQDEPRDRGLIKGRGTFDGDKPPVLTLVRRDTGEVRFLVCETLENADKAIASRGDESVILCTDQYRIYDGIDEYDCIDGHLAINHGDHFVVGDAHTNGCENRHSFLRQWLGKFRGVSKHRLQGYLDFLSLLVNTDAWFDQLLGRECYT